LFSAIISSAFLPPSLAMSLLPLGRAPNLDSEMVRHLHADDAARWIICAIDNRAVFIGEVFNTMSDQAVALNLFAWLRERPVSLSSRPLN
jgi:hypothetical protein